MIAALAAMVIFAGGRAIAQERPQSEISVSANSSVSAEPDIAEFRIGIIERQEQATSAFRSYVLTYESLRNALGSVVDTTKLTTDNLSVTPFFNYKKPEQVTPDYYQVTASMSLSVPIPKLNGVLGSITSVDGVTINGIEFRASNEKELERKALELAVKDARAKAEAIARLEGLTDLKVKSMNTSTSRPPIMPMYRAMSIESAAPSINASSISVSASINVTYTANQK